MPVQQPPYQPDTGRHFRPTPPAERFPAGMVYVGQHSGNVYRCTADDRLTITLHRNHPSQQPPSWWGRGGKHRRGPGFNGCVTYGPLGGWLRETGCGLYEGIG